MKKYILTLDEGTTSARAIIFDNMGNIVSIGSDAFRNNTSMVMFNSNQQYKINVPDTCESIGSCAFINCKLIKEIYVPNSVITIDTYAFGGCISLETLTIPFIPEGSHLGKLFSSSSTTGMYESYDDYYIPSTLTTVNITNSESIPSRAFYGCAKIKVINLVESAILGDNALKNCTATVNYIYIKSKD